MNARSISERVHTFLEIIRSELWGSRKSKTTFTAYLPTLRTRVPYAFFKKNHITLGSYNDPDVHAAIIECKFHKNHDAMHALASAWSPFLKQVCLDSGLPVRIMSVPVHYRRIRDRGYDHLDAILSLCADPVIIKARDTTTLTKNRATARQTELSRKDRLTNVTGAFTAHGDLHGIHVVLFDDVYTTGSTIAECVRTLTAAGASAITVCVCAVAE